MCCVMLIGNGYLRTVPKVKQERIPIMFAKIFITVSVTLVVLLTGMLPAGFAADTRDPQGTSRMTAPDSSPASGTAPARVMPPTSPKPKAGTLPGAPGNITSGCCQTPAPAGLDCCDTRDCGWFKCEGARKGSAPTAPSSFTQGCCQKPAPAGLHCCDTRDCGWFNCND
jgi:hypothetical protein